MKSLKQILKRLFQSENSRRLEAVKIAIENREHARAITLKFKECQARAAATTAYSLAIKTAETAQATASSAILKSYGEQLSTAWENYIRCPTSSNLESFLENIDDYKSTLDTVESKIQEILKKDYVAAQQLHNKILTEKLKY